MCFHDTRLFAWLLDWSMRRRDLAPYRERTVAAVRGVVLEIGVGSGLNLPLYRAGVTRVYAIEPSAELLDLAGTRRNAAVETVLVRASAEALPFKNASFHTIVTTWTLCTIPDPLRALQEMRRVLDPGGRLLFVEHGYAADRRVARWQNWLTPVWKRITGGCHLDRKIDDLIRAAGFQIDGMNTGYLRGANPFTYMYEGAASVAHDR